MLLPLLCRERALRCVYVWCAHRAVESPPDMDQNDFVKSFDATQGLFSYVPDNRPAMREPSTINVAAFIEANLTPYDGDASFLAGPTEKTQKLWDIVQDLQMQEFRKGGESRHASSSSLTAQSLPAVMFLTHTARPPAGRSPGCGPRHAQHHHLLPGGLH